MKKILCLILMFAALFSLAACGKEPAKTEIVPMEEEKKLPENMIEGYVREKIQMPEKLENGDRDLGVQGFYGDIMYFMPESDQGSSVFAYDTVKAKWAEYEMKLDGVYNPRVIFCPTENSLWALIKETPTYSDTVNNKVPKDLGYYLFHMDIKSGEQSLNRLNFEAEYRENIDAAGETNNFSGFFAIDDEKAAVVSPETLFIVNSAGENMEKRENTGAAFPYFYHKNKPWFWVDGECRAFDPQTLSFSGESVPERTYISSNTEEIYFIDRIKNELYKLENNEECRCFNYTEGAESLQGAQVNTGFVNSDGFFFMENADGLYKLVKGLIPDRKPLNMLCLGSVSSYDGEKYTNITAEMQDAIIRFNNNDAEFKINIKTIYPKDEADLARNLIELANSSDIDLIDVSYFPEGAVDSSLLVDMLPYIDNDEDISREDFIPKLFNLMLKDGGLYRYTDKFTILTMTTHPEFATEKEGWTVEKIREIMEEHKDMSPTWHSYDWNYLTNLFAWAASAEFIDYENRSCDFESEAFIHWLELIKALPDGEEWNSSEPAKLFDFTFDFVGMEPGWSNRYILKGDYAVTGFPESRGCGSYFLKLGSSSSEMRTTSGQNISLGIMASGQHHEGAWRFVKCLMEGESKYTRLNEGIPVVRDRFEALIQKELEKGAETDPEYNLETFNEKDGELFRQLVYSCDGLCSSDEGLINIITTEIRNYLDGKFDAPSAAEQIQSRVSIYLSEQS